MVSPSYLCPILSHCTLLGLTISRLKRRCGYYGPLFGSIKRLGGGKVLYRADPKIVNSCIVEYRIALPWRRVWSTYPMGKPSLSLPSLLASLLKPMTSTSTTPSSPQVGPSSSRPLTATMTMTAPNRLQTRKIRSTGQQSIPQNASSLPHYTTTISSYPPSRIRVTQTSSRQPLPLGR